MSDPVLSVQIDLTAIGQAVRTALPEISNLDAPVSTRSSATAVEQVRAIVAASGSSYGGSLQ